MTLRHRRPPQGGRRRGRRARRRLRGHPAGEPARHRHLRRGGAAGAAARGRAGRALLGVLLDAAAREPQPARRRGSLGAALAPDALARQRALVVRRLRLPRAARLAAGRCSGLAGRHDVAGRRDPRPPRAGARRRGRAAARRPRDRAPAARRHARPRASASASPPPPRRSARALAAALASAGVGHVVLSTAGDWLRPLAAVPAPERGPPVSFAAPLWLLGLLRGSRPRSALYVLLERRRGRSAARFASPAPAAEPRRRRPRPAPPRPGGGPAARLAAAARRLRAPARDVRCRASRRRSCSRSTSPGRWPPGTCSRVRLAARPRVAAAFVDRLPKGFRIAVVTFSDHAPSSRRRPHDLAPSEGGARRGTAGPQGTALAGSVAQAVQVGRRCGPDEQRQAPACSPARLSDGPPERAPHAPAGRRGGAQARDPGLDGLARHAGRGRAAAAATWVHGADPGAGAARHAAQIAQGSGGPFFSSLGAVDVERVYRELGSRVGKRVKTIEVSAVAAGGGLVFMLAGALLSGLWFRRLV